MKQIKNGLTALLLATGLTFTGCEKRGIYYENESSPVLHEQARVAQTVYVPASDGHGSTTGYNFGKGGGLTVSSVNIHIPAKYAVVFECQHGKFIIEGGEDKYKTLWEKLKDNQTVDVEYKEIYEVKYSYEGNDNKTALEKNIIKYDFLNANPIE